MRSITKGSLVFALTIMSAACSGDISNAPLAPTDAPLAQKGGRVSLPFRGSISQADTVWFVGPNLIGVGTGEGTATHLGRYTMTVDAVAPLDAPGTATGNYHFTAANGDQLDATFVGTAAPNPSGEDWTFTEILTIVGGTGRFASATGTLTMIKIVVIDFAGLKQTGIGTMEGSIQLNR